MDRYRVVVIDNSAFDKFPANIASLTADRLCADILPPPMPPQAGIVSHGLAFVWQRCRLQLAPRTSRLSALVCGGWPTGGQYAETLAYTEEEAAQGRTPSALTFYRSVRGWPEREAVSKFTFPRMAFAGNK